MKTIYIECNMGAAGDMMLAALIELMPQPEAFIDRLNSLGIPGVRYVVNSVSKCGITGTQIDVEVNGETEHDHHNHHHHYHHHHRTMHDIEHIISSLNLSEQVKDNALKVYKNIAAAESVVHGRTVEEIHFHEVGAMDAVADVVGVCMAFEELAPDSIIASPVNTGSGTVKCAHGILPVPAPATAEILKDIPSYGSDIKGELCTPTGAALLACFVSEFSAMPPMRVSEVGYGMGHKDFETANCIRMMLGTAQGVEGRISELRCNIDDMTGEAIGYAVEKLFSEGALDVFTIPVGMKKNRPGILLTCMCREKDREKFIGLIFKHTSTIGVREYLCNRYTLTRSEVSLDTDFGEVRAKKSEGWGVTRIKPEYEDLRHIANENDISISDIKIK